MEQIGFCGNLVAWPVGFRVHRLLFFLVFVASFDAAASAAVRYRFDNWTVDQGLPQNIVTAIHQTRDGYLWIATLDGLARFDGVRFTVFDKNNTPGINTHRFTTLFEDAAGDLWLGAESGKVTRSPGQDLFGKVGSVPFSYSITYDTSLAPDPVFLVARRSAGKRFTRTSTATPKRASRPLDLRGAHALLQFAIAYKAEI